MDREFAFMGKINIYSGVTSLSGATFTGKLTVTSSSVGF
jgi:hypothetical protein